MSMEKIINKCGRPTIYNNDDMLSFIKEFISKKQYSPSVRDVMNGLGIKSTSVTYYHLKKLRDLGLIDFKDNIARSITVK